MRKCDPFEVAAEAQSWVGTPYKHQHRMKGSFCDCVGLINGVGLALDILDMTPESWAPYARYSRTPNPSKMREAMHRFLVPVDQAAAPAVGLIAWMQWRDGLPMHLGIIGQVDNRLTLIHAFEHSGGCVQHGFVDPWPSRVESWWRYPGMI